MGERLVTDDKVQYSPDRVWLWNGREWVLNPDERLTSPDGVWWWNGTEWVPNPDYAATRRRLRRADRWVAISAVIVGALLLLGIVLAVVSSAVEHAAAGH